MSKFRALLQQHPVLAYCVAVFAISWGGTLLVLGPAGLPTDAKQAEMMLVVAYVAMLAGPALAGVLLTGILDGRAGLREFAARLLKWRSGAGWYAVALLTAPLLILTVLLALTVISPDFIPRLYTETDKAALLQFSFVAGLLVGVFEELGWTGFVVPRVIARYGVVKTGLAVGFLYGAWNFLVVLWMSTVTGTAGTLPMVIFIPITLFTWLPTYRVLMVWVYKHTESLLVAMLMHTSLITFWTALTPRIITGISLVTYYLLFTAATWAVIALVLRSETARRPAQAIPSSK